MLTEWIQILIDFDSVFRIFDEGFFDSALFSAFFAKRTFLTKICESRALMDFLTIDEQTFVIIYSYVQRTPSSIFVQLSFHIRILDSFLHRFAR